MTSKLVFLVYTVHVIVLFPGFQMVRAHPNNQTWEIYIVCVNCVGQLEFLMHLVVTVNVYTTPFL